MGIYKPSLPHDDEDEENYPTNLTNGDLGNSQTVLTESSQDKGWNRIEDADSVDDVPTSIVNVDAIYVNSTFKGELIIAL